MDDPKYQIGQIVIACRDDKNEFSDIDGEQLDFCHNVLKIQGEIVQAEFVNIAERDHNKWVYQIKVMDDSNEFVFLATEEVCIEKIIS